MTQHYDKETGNEGLWYTIFNDGHPALQKQHWLHKKMPKDPRCKMCFTPFTGVGGWVQRTFRKKKPSSRNPHYCSACDKFLIENPGGAEVPMSILFVDVRESTKFAALATPTDVGNRINHFLDAATKIITDNDGFVMAFYGDCIVAVWPPGFSGQNHSEKALQTAQALTDSESIVDANGEVIPVGVGCHTGNVYIGTVSAVQGSFRDVSIFGKNVILTARLASKAEAGEALISDECWHAAGAGDNFGMLKRFNVKGLEEEISAHSVTADSTQS